MRRCTAAKQGAFAKPAGTCLCIAAGMSFGQQKSWALLMLGWRAFCRLITTFLIYILKRPKEPLLLQTGNCRFLSMFYHIDLRPR
jgi:hypothetical protein